MKECGGKTRAGHPCRRPPMRSGRCPNHGGALLSGIASPSFKTGRYSKHLPTRMAGRYQEAQQDPELLVLQDEIALIDSRLSDLLTRVDSGESGALWAQLVASWQAFMTARASGNVQRMTELLNAHEEVLERGRADYAAWSEIGTLLDRRQRFVESERKRYVEMSQMVSLESAMLFLGAVTDAVRRHVSDTATRAVLGRELERLADAPPRPLAPGRRGRAGG